jgi:hypothetical protein
MGEIQVYHVSNQKHGKVADEHFVGSIQLSNVSMWSVYFPSSCDWQTSQVVLFG